MASMQTQHKQYFDSLVCCGIGRFQGEQDMLTITTNSIEGRRIAEYYGIVSGEAIYGANIFRDIFAGIRDIVGGRSGAYERVLKDGRDRALEDMIEEAEKLGANAVIGVDIDYESLGAKGSMLMVSVTGTAVRLE